MPTIQHPEYVVINGERYPVARDKKGARLWREIRVPVQPGGGEKQVTFDSWDLGMGYSRLKQPGTYEYCTAGGNATAPWKFTIGPQDGARNAASGHKFYRLIEYDGCLYAIGVTASDNDLYVVRLNSSGEIDYQAEIGAGQADGPPGQPAAWEGELYVGVSSGTAYKLGPKSDSGTADVAVTCGASTLTDSREAWTVNEWSGCIITCDSKTMTVETNTADTLTGAASWDASQPGDEKSWTLTGSGWTRGNACDALHFCRVGRDLWAVPLGTKGKISKLPAGASWTWGTDDTAVGTSPWGALYGVGDTGQAIKSLQEWGRWLYIGKPEGLFSGDSDGYIWNQIPAIATSSNNCLQLTHWQGRVWAPTINGLYRYSGLGARTQGPEVLRTNASPVRAGYFRALTHAGLWLYGAYKAQDDKTYLMTARLREAEEPGVGELIWHIFGSLPSTFTIEDIRVAAHTDPPRLWVIFSVAPSNIYYALYYYHLNDDGSIDPNDSGYRNDTGATHSLYLPRIDLGSPGTTKAGHFAEVHSAGTISATQWIKLYADWDGGGFNQVGSTIATAATTFSRLFWTAGSNDTGRVLQLRVDMQSDATDARPELERITANLIESPRREPGIRCSLRVGNMLDKKNSAKKVEENLNGLDCGSVYTMTDPDDPAAGTVSVIVHDMEFIPTEDPGEIQGERQCNLTLRVVEYS